MFRKLLFALPAVVLGLLALTGAGSAANAATTINVKVGGGAPGYTVNLFAPGTVYVQPGDSVKWTFPWLEPHSVTFGVPAGDPSVLVGGANPSYDGTAFISSGLVFGGPTSSDSYSVTFPKKGTFNYFCILHPGMTASVVVQTPDLGQPDNQASVDGRAAALLTSSMNELKALAAASGAKAVAVTPKQGGGKTYSLAISSLRDSAVGDVQQFFPASASIAVNDTVEWVSNVHTPHTVSFGNPGDIAKLIPAGGADAILGLPQSIPAGGKYDGTGIATSAVLGIGFGPTKFELTFTKAGSYDYLCMLHADQNMMAKIVVGGAGSAPGAPNTGTSASQPDGSTGMWVIFGAIAMVAAASAGAFAVTRR